MTTPFMHAPGGTESDKPLAERTPLQQMFIPPTPAEQDAEYARRIAAAKEHIVQTAIAWDQDYQVTDQNLCDAIDVLRQIQQERI